MTLALTSAQNLINILLIIPYIIILIYHLSFSNSQQLSPDDLEKNNRRYCDKELCDSLVSKCTLTDRCSCNFKKEKECARDCINCLEEKFGKCCACVG